MCMASVLPCVALRWAGYALSVLTGPGVNSAGGRYRNRRAPIAQLAEAADLKSAKCRFESDWGHRVSSTGFGVGRYGAAARAGVRRALLHCGHAMSIVTAMRSANRENVLLLIRELGHRPVDGGDIDGAVAGPPMPGIPPGPMPPGCIICIIGQSPDRIFPVS